MSPPDYGPGPYEERRPGAFLPAPAASFDLDRMPRDLPRAYKAELARGVRDNGAAQANTYIASAYVQGAGLLAQEAVMLAAQLAELEGAAVERVPWAEARIQAINNAFTSMAVQEITNLRRGR